MSSARPSCSTPQRGRAHHHRTRGAGGDTVAERPHVVQQEVGIRMDGPVPQHEVEGGRERHTARRRRDESRGVERRPDTRDVTATAADRGEQALPGAGVGALGERRRCVQSAHEIDEPVDVRASFGVGLVLGVVIRVQQHAGQRLVESTGAAIVREVGIADTDLVQIGVGREREEARVLVLPPEPAHANVARRFEHRDLNHLSVDGAPALARLRVGDRHEGVRVDRFDEPVAVRVGRHAERPDVFSARHAFLNRRIDRTVVDQRSTRRVDEVAARQMPGAQFADLADGAGHRVLVTFDAALRVVYRSEAVGDLIAFLERQLRGIEVRLSEKSVGQVVEPRGRLRRPALTLNGQ